MKNWRRGLKTDVSWLRSMEVYIGGKQIYIGEKHAVLVRLNLLINMC